MIPTRNPRFRNGLLAIALLGAGIAPASAVDYIDIPRASFESVLPPTDSPIPVNVGAFHLRSTPVTNAEFLAFVNAHPEWRRDRVPAVFAESRYLQGWPAAAMIAPAQRVQPVTEVSWFAAQAFCENENARLPTWHEWEYAAAADGTRPDARSDPAWRERILGWYAQTSGKPLANVGGDANFHGVRDLHGLVWEWVDDFNALMVSADNREQGDPDLQRFCGAGALSMQDRDNYAVLMRIALLSSLKAADVTANLGFRCARDVSAGGTP